MTTPIDVSMALDHLEEVARDALTDASKEETLPDADRRELDKQMRDHVYKLRR
jgi:hypothetical protein